MDILQFMNEFAIRSIVAVSARTISDFRSFHSYQMALNYPNQGRIYVFQFVFIMLSFKYVQFLM